MSEQVAEAIRAEIRRDGPIGFDAFMRHALYGPGGFFERPPIGAEGHFVTSPHVHPWVFSRCVRAALLEAWDALDEPEPFALVELGAGDGTLAEALVAAFEELGRPPLGYTAVEVSGGARDRLAERGLHAVERVEDLAPFAGAVIANELLDNLPFLLAERTATGVAEIRIGLDGDRLVEVGVPWDHAVPHGLDDAEPRARTAVPLGAFELLSTLAAMLTRGYALFVDYGTLEGPTGGAHGYREHRSTGDLLTDPGSTDVTSGVDLGALGRTAEAEGLVVHGAVRQSAALDALGFGRWAEAMREMQSMLTREGKAADAARIWQARSRASLLVDQGHFGSFWWLVLSTPDLPSPAWLDRAAGDRPTAD